MTHSSSASGEWSWRTGSIAFGHFLCALTKLSDANADECDIREQGGAALRALVAEDDWLLEEFCQPDPAQYRQYLLYCDPLERFRWSALCGVRGSARRSTTTPCGADRHAARLGNLAQLHRRVVRAG